VALDDQHEDESISDGSNDEDNDGQDDTDVQGDVKDNVARSRLRKFVPTFKDVEESILSVEMTVKILSHGSKSLKI